MNLAQLATVGRRPPSEAAKSPLPKPVRLWVLGPAFGGQRDLVQALKGCSQLPPDCIVREDMRARDTALDPGEIKGSLFFRDPRRSYVKVTKGVFQKLSAGPVKF